MSETEGNITPGGRPALQENPLSSEIGPMDSGGGQTLQNSNDNHAMDLDTPAKISYKIAKQFYRKHHKGYTI